MHTQQNKKSENGKIGVHSSNTRNIDNHSEKQAISTMILITNLI